MNYTFYSFLRYFLQLSVHFVLAYCAGFSFACEQVGDGFSVIQRLGFVVVDAVPRQAFMLKSSLHLTFFFILSFMVPHHSNLS